MTSTTSLPWYAEAGNAAVAWIMRGMGFGAARVLKAPGASAGLAAVAVTIVMGGANALFWQSGLHPSPMFFETAAIAAPNAGSAQTDVSKSKIPAAIVPAPTLTRNVSAVPVVSVPNTVPVKEIGNKDVGEMQTKLAQLNFYTGKVDGYYGPNTANAIRAFEAANGLKTKGELNQQIMAVIAKAPLPNTAIVPLSQVAVNTHTQVVVAPAPSTRQPVMPRPISSPQQTAVVPAKKEQSTTIVDPITQIAREVATRTEQSSTSTQGTATAPVKAKFKLTPDVVANVQTNLAKLGFYTGKVNGSYDAETARAVREFEGYNNFKMTGKIDSSLLQLLHDAGVV